MGYTSPLLRLEVSFEAALYNLLKGMNTAKTCLPAADEKSRAAGPRVATVAA